MASYLCWTFLAVLSWSIFLLPSPYFRFLTSLLTGPAEITVKSKVVELTTTIECSVSGARTENMDVEWSKDGGRLPLSSEEMIYDPPTLDEGSLLSSATKMHKMTQLTISRTNKVDTGTYRCSITFNTDDGSYTESGTAQVGLVSGNSLLSGLSNNPVQNCRCYFVFFWHKLTKERLLWCVRVCVRACVCVYVCDTQTGVELLIRHLTFKIGPERKRSKILSSSVRH